MNKAYTNTSKTSKVDCNDQVLSIGRFGDIIFGGDWDDGDDS